MNRLVDNARLLVKRLMASRTVKPASVVPTVGADAVETAPPRSVMDRANLRATQYTNVRLVQFAVVTNILLAGTSFVAVKYVEARPVQMIQNEGDLREQVRAYFVKENGSAPEKNEIAHFVWTMLNMKHQVSEAGAPFLPLLQGFVANEVYKDAAENVRRNAVSVKERQVTQSLFVENIVDVVFDDNAKRLGATIVGKVTVTARKTARGYPITTDVPYRARIFLDIIPRSAINPWGYFVAAPLREVFGQAETDTFDREMEARRGKIRGEK